MLVLDPIFGPDPGAEPIIIEKADKEVYCFSCGKKMLKNSNFFECPICYNRSV